MNSSSLICEVERAVVSMSSPIDIIELVLETMERDLRDEMKLLGLTDGSELGTMYAASAEKRRKQIGVIQFALFEIEHQRDTFDDLVRKLYDFYFCHKQQENAEQAAAEG